MTRYKMKVEFSKDWAHIILRGFCWIALLTRRGVELIQRVVPREALSQIDSICELIVIAQSTFSTLQ